MEKSTRKGAASKFATSEELFKYLSKLVLSISGRSKDAQISRDIIAEDSLRLTYYIDIEFAGATICEVAILDLKGNTVFNIILDWEKDYSVFVKDLNGSFIAKFVFARYYMWKANLR